MSSTPNTTSYWCYRCIRFVTVTPNDNNDAVSCPHCETGFIEQIHTDTTTTTDATSSSPQINPARRFTRILSSNGRDDPIPIPARFRRRSRRNSRGDRSPFNPVIVLRGSTSSAAPTPAASLSEEGANRYEFFYDDGSGSGLRPVPETMSEFLMGWGFDRLLEQLTQIEVTRPGNPPASKAAVESLPTVEIGENHVVSDSQCAVCMEMFKLGCEATELPCKHIYHKDCILPWLEMRNSCPVCRHELPVEERGNEEEGETVGGEGDEGDQELVGLTIWRLPGGGFAVGRFRGEREREFPSGVFTEMDGEMGARPRRVSWVSGRRRSRVESGTDSSTSASSNGANRSGGGGGGFGRVFRGLVSYLRRIGSGSSSSSASVSGPNVNDSLSNANDDDDSGSVVMASPRDLGSLESGRYIRRRRRGLDFLVS